MSDVLNSKRFVLRKALIGKDVTVSVTFKNGNQVKYSHDAAFAIMKDSLETMPCWEKYKSYTSGSNIPKAIRDTAAVLSVILAKVTEKPSVEVTPAKSKASPKATKGAAKKVASEVAAKVSGLVPA